MRQRSCAAIAVALLAGVPGARGQQVTLAQLVPIAGRRAHTQAERQRVRAWVADQIKQLSSPDDPAAPDKFRRSFRTFLAPDPTMPVTAEFLDLLAAEASRQFPVTTGQTDGRVALMQGLVFAEFVSPDVADGLAKCLTHENQGVRYWGAKGLWRLRPRLLGSTNTLKRVAAALGQAGANETNAIALRQICFALNYATERAPAGALVLGDLIQAGKAVAAGRLKVYRAKKAAGIAADGDLAELLADYYLYEQTPAKEKREILGAIGQLMQAAGALRASLEPRSQLREKLAQTIVRCEAALRRVVTTVNPTTAASLPKVGEQALKSDTPDQLITLGILGWVGSRDVPGVLNKPPFNVAVPPPFTFDDAGAP